MHYDVCSLTYGKLVSIGRLVMEKSINKWLDKLQSNFPFNFWMPNEMTILQFRREEMNLQIGPEFD